MNKADLSKQISEETGVDRHMTEVVINRALRVMQAAFESNEAVSIQGFGVFSVKVRPERRGRNPRTGETITIARSRAVTFKPSKTLRDALNP